MSHLEAKKISTVEKNEMGVGKKKDFSSEFYFDHESLNEKINQLSKQIHNVETFDTLILIKKLENDIKVQQQKIQVSYVSVWLLLLFIYSSIVVLCV